VSKNYKTKNTYEIEKGKTNKTDRPHSIISEEKISLMFNGTQKKTKHM
jgi:hypothetical protein